MYCYYDKNMTNLKFLYSLSSCYIRDSNQLEIIGNVLYYSIILKISLQFKRTFYFRSLLEKEQWKARLSKATGIRLLKNHYSLGPILGEGQFGKIFLGVPVPCSENLLSRSH